MARFSGLRPLLLVYLSKPVLRRVLLEGTGAPASWSIEHVVPVSVLGGRKEPAALDMHNMMVIPSLLNSHRSDYEYAERVNGSVPLQLDCFKCSRHRYFTPRDSWKGMISRKVFYMRYKYPMYESLIEARVLRKDLMQQWARDYPVTVEERRLEQLAARSQGNRNPFVLRAAWDSSYRSRSRAPKRP